MHQSDRTSPVNHAKEKKKNQLNIPSVHIHVLYSALQRSDIRSRLSISVKETELTSADSHIQTNPHTHTAARSDHAAQTTLKRGQMEPLAAVSQYHSVFFSSDTFTHTHTHIHTHTARKATLKP